MDRAEIAGGVRLWAAAAVALCLILTGQARGSSVFSLNTTGEPILPMDGRSRGMGGLSIALFDNNAGLSNPGVIGWADRMCFSVTYLPEIQKPEDDTGGNRIGFSYFPHLGGVIPLPYGIVSGIELGLIRGYGFLSETEVTGSEVGSFESRVSKEGGAYRFSVGLGRAFYRRASLGIFYDRLLGNARERWSYDYANQAIADISTRLETGHSGHGLRLGTGLMLGRINLGFFWSLPLTVSLQNRLYLEDETVVETTPHPLNLRSRELRYPWTTGLGLVHRPDSSLILGVEAVYSPTSGIEVDGARTDRFADHLRLSVGLEYRRSSRSTSSFPARTAWRLGYYQQNWETKIFGRSLGERFFTLGIGLPMAFIEGSIDLGLEYGRRSAEFPDQGDGWKRVDESIWRLSFSLKGREKWQKRRSPWDEEGIDW